VIGGTENSLAKPQNWFDNMGKLEINGMVFETTGWLMRKLVGLVRKPSRESRTKAEQQKERADQAPRR